MIFKVYCILNIWISTLIFKATKMLVTMLIEFITALVTEFSNALREILSYEEILTHRFYIILRNLGWLSSSNNTIKCISNRARWILTQHFLELGKPCGLKFPRKMRSPVKRLRGRPHAFKFSLFVAEHKYSDVVFYILALLIRLQYPYSVVNNKILETLLFQL